MSQYGPNPSNPAPWGQDQAGLQFPWLEYVQLLWFRRRLILAVTVFVAVIGYIQVSEIKNVYSATSTMLINMPEKWVAGIEDLLNQSINSNDIEGEIEILRSRNLAIKVVKRLNLVNNPEFNPALQMPEKSAFDFLAYVDPRRWIPESWSNALREATGHQTERVEPPPPVTALSEEEQREQQLISTAADILLGKVNIKALEWASGVTVTVSSLDPATAARLANEYPDAYIVDKMEARFEAAEKANNWLAEQLQDLEVKVVESERAVEIYRDEHGLGETEGASLLDTQLSELNSQLMIARAEKAEVDARLAQLRRLLLAGGQGVETAAEVMSSALVQQLRTQEAQALSRASELSVEYGPKHPRMLQVQAELVEIRERIHEEVQHIAVGLAHEAEFARTKVASLEESLLVAQGQTSEQNKEAIQLRALQREAAANRTLYETFLEQAKTSSSTKSLDTTDSRVISAAEVPGAASYPDRSRMMLNYILGGLLASCGLVIGLQMLNPGLNSPEQVQEMLGEYVIGLIPLIPEKTAAYEYVLKKPTSFLVEALKSLKFSLDLSDPDHPVKAVQVTSSVPEEGKTTLAISLARVVASSGNRVLLVDADLRRSRAGKRLGLAERHKGLSDLLVAGHADLAEFIQHDDHGDVDFLSTGTADFVNASDIFSSHRIEEIIALLKSHYDLVVIDSPPVMVVADARIIGRVVDKTLFAVGWNKTPRKVVRAGIDLLRRSKVSLAGVVLQKVDLKRYGHLGYSSSGHYYHQARYGDYYSE
jgi:succinoglycan biosynthesis transport protein ExoP